MLGADQPKVGRQCRGMHYGGLRREHAPECSSFDSERNDATKPVHVTTVNAMTAARPPANATMAKESSANAVMKAMMKAKLRGSRMMPKAQGSDRHYDARGRRCDGSPAGRRGQRYDGSQLTMSKVWRIVATDA